MKTMFASFLMVMALMPVANALAADPVQGYQDEDWNRLRHDVTESTRRSETNGNFAARRQAIRDRARNRYLEADKDRNGSLNRNELSRQFPRLANHFDFIDSNHDGQVTEQEIAEALRKRMQQRRLQYDQQPN